MIDKNISPEERKLFFFRSNGMNDKDALEKVIEENKGICPKEIDKDKFDEYIINLDERVKKSLIKDLD